MRRRVHPGALSVCFQNVQNVSCQFLFIGVSVNHDILRGRAHARGRTRSSPRWLSLCTTNDDAPRNARQRTARIRADVVASMAHYTAEATLYVILGACVPPLMLVALRELKRWQIFSNEPALLLAARKSGSGGLDDERSAAIGPLPHETHVHFVIGDDQTSTEVVVDPSSSYEFLLDQLALVGMEAMRPAFPLTAAALRIEYGISDGAECAVWLAATSQTPMQSLLEARFGLLVTVTPPTASFGLPVAPPTVLSSPPRLPPPPAAALPASPTTLPPPAAAQLLAPILPPPPADRSADSSESPAMAWLNSVGPQAAEQRERLQATSKVSPNTCAAPPLLPL